MLVEGGPLIVQSYIDTLLSNVCSVTFCGEAVLNVMDLENKELCIHTQVKQ